jgi:peptide/nickel transport system permease protein
VAGYLIRRLAQSILVIVLVSVAAFSMVHLVPGDPVSIMLREQASAEQVERLRSELGLDKPIPVQYWNFANQAVIGDLGTSIRSRQPVTSEIAGRMASTLELTFAAMALAIMLGVSLGIAAAATHSAALDFLVMGFALVGLSMPTFWSGLLLILLFGLTLHWLPVVSEGGLSSLVLPAITLALPAAAVLARLMRSSMLEVLDQDYIRTARSKGLSRRAVIYRHAVQNAFIPVLTIIGLQFGGLLAGSVIVESVFARPGVGRLAVQAILARDFPLVQGIVLLAGVAFVLLNLTVDLLYPVFDPRITLGRR